MRRSSIGNSSHQIHEKGVGNNHLRVVESPHGLEDPFMLHEHLGTLNADLTPHQGLLEPHSAGRRVVVLIGTEPATER